VSRHLDNILTPTGIPDWDAEGTTIPKEQILITHNRKELRDLMSDYVAIVRSDERLNRAQARLHILYHETEQLYHGAVLSSQLCELRNLITVAYLIATQSLARTENRGVYYNVDHSTA
jgi:L-aspartate oxidase